MIRTYLEMIYSFSYNGYWLTIIVVHVVATVGHILKLRMGKDYDWFWKAVKIWRFLRPARYMMFGILLLTWAATDKASDWTSYFALLWPALQLYYKDDFGDDPRNKKPSKVMSLIKSLGHRLVIVPQ